MVRERPHALRHFNASPLLPGHRHRDHDHDFWHITPAGGAVILGNVNAKPEMKMARGKTGKPRKLLWAGIGVLVVAGAMTAYWIHRFHRYTPVEVVQDIRAGIASRHAPRPVERFLELRYGPLTEPANRQKAFLDFFNVGHIEGLQIITRHMQGQEQKSNITAMAQWVENYRSTMTPGEKQVLSEFVQSAPGRKALQQAASQYLKQDVHYRSATAPVIEQLMTTLAAVQKP
jgi:hypothetical protein